MEDRLGHDFSAVRIHTDERASRSAASVSARAFTVGHHVVFGGGQFRQSAEGNQQLIAHELVHTMQQRAGSRPVGPLAIGPALDGSEREADRIVQGAFQSDRFMARSAVGSAASLVTPVAQRMQRACGPAAIGTPGACAARSGDITDFGGSSDRLFLFTANCDEFSAGEKARVTALAGTIGPADTVTVDGFASEEGPATFNENLSCARAMAVANMLAGAGIGSAIALFQHGATPGVREDNRSAVVTVQPSVSPAPVSTPPVAACSTPANADLSGAAFNPTTTGQTRVALSNPIDAFTVNDLADDALAAARGSGFSGIHLGPADAFRHCFWNCRMAQELGAATAEEFGTGHENSGPSAIPFDNRMDLHNNATGRSFGAPNADCDAQCRTAVTTGLLRTVRGPHTRPPASPPVTVDCIGPSDQPWP